MDAEHKPHSSAELAKRLRLDADVYEKGAMRLVLRADILEAADRIESLEEQLEALRNVLVDARTLAIRVADKNIGLLSDQAREVQGAVNVALGDLPTPEEVAGILAASTPASAPGIAATSTQSEAFPEGNDGEAGAEDSSPASEPRDSGITLDFARGEVRTGERGVQNQEREPQYCTCPEGADGNPCAVCGKPESVTDWNVVMNAREDENDPMRADQNQESEPKEEA